MNCPHCNERIRFRDLLDKLIMSISIEWHWTRLREREIAQEAANLRELNVLYTADARLTEREQAVCLYRICGATYGVIADNMNVTRERVRQIEAKALRKLRNK